MNKLYEAVFREFEKEYIKTKKSFCIKNVERELIEKFNTARIATNRTIRDWVKSAVDRGELVEYNGYCYKWR